MSKETLRVLEYDKVRSLLARFTSTVPGRELALELQPLPEKTAVAEALAEVGEMCQLLEQVGRPPVGACCDLLPALRQLSTEGVWLPAEQLLEVQSSLEAAHDCRNYLAERPQAPLLSGLAAGLQPCVALRREIGESIGPRGEILDSASFELGDLRYQLRRLRERIRKILEELLLSDRYDGVFQDRLVTERNGRYVVPVKADHRGRLKGFVHDESASGQTLFVEPTAVLDKNNELQALQRAEQRELERILRRLADGVRHQGDALRENQQILARLDLRAAAARFARFSDGSAPQLVDKPLIELKGARHPLLLFEADGTPIPDQAVAIDLLLPADKDTLVISGPNTGGKSVALKTAGLLVLMVRSGLHVPCRPDSRLFLFDEVFADIGDEQSIEQSLSTFSGHLSRMRQILQQADRYSLVLLDEAGTGTDPAEGAALAMAVLDELRGAGAKTLVTTHLNLVKGYALLESRVENAAVEFDERTLQPTYRLHYGIPGASKAFTIARRLGLPESLLSRAEGYLGEGEKAGLDLIEKINQQQQELSRRLEEAEQLRKRARLERTKRKQLLEEFEGQRQALLDKARRRGEGLVREAEDKIKRLFKDLRQEAPDVAGQARLTGELRQVREAMRPVPATKPQSTAVPKDVAVGELLRIPALASEGEVVRVAGDEAELSVQGKKLRLSLSSLEQFQPRRFARRKSDGGKVRNRVERDAPQSRLLLVGKRVDEALVLLDRFVDDALLQGLAELEIVHGCGEGILRRAVREFLAGHREVEAFHAADLARGGDNVTIAQLRRA
ncbi:DNA mismatch repair protein MutS [Syntrophotalea acetylenivorans]|uniref:Endonuclease MutS2 n=1 Tax=Syntrophotalea acetylenivorans TaxID=1842532 RepID=A0A1L3GPE9_9BACT|nr:endonuclease MutS2 [Syntrophotalea acetylenivorans]APG27819.1 DNA mismatch repair protein MutS [Syntrophotalea acetylenivorans]